MLFSTANASKEWNDAGMHASYTHVSHAFCYVTCCSLLLALLLTGWIIVVSQGPDQSTLLTMSVHPIAQL